MEENSQKNIEINGKMVPLDELIKEYHNANAASHGERTRGLVVPSRRRSVVLSES